MTTHAPHDTVIRNAEDLEMLWRGLLGDGGFSRRSVWLLFLGPDGRPAPVLVPLDDLPRRPGPGFLDSVRQISRELVGTQDIASMAMLLSRPGHVTMTDEDRAWARALHEVCRDWPPFLAVAGAVHMFAPDDLLP